ncbi:AlkA N-terminal domain-containing protein [Ornithinimicrobium sp. W1679]|uniref:AlkA N-terminal domain-containing protein n=1 Tax=Ornithinimicrobium sp. W1679 TaxID=3418770 RepID=UPI003CE77857
MQLDHDRCVTAVRSKDPRFDGWFVTAVTSTGIYCRPSCPAITPKVVHLSFYPSAAAAQRAGFRACRRCLPDSTPGSPRWRPRADLVARAVRLVADGVVDREGVTGLADRLGYSTRQLERLVTAELGAGPLALARAQRAQTARVLLESTDLTVTDVAHAAGFGSVRAFNDTVRAVYATTPTTLRRTARSRGRGAPGGAVGAGEGETDGVTGQEAGTAAQVEVRLPFRPPLHVPSLVEQLRGRVVPGVEAWRDGGWERSLALPHGPGVVRLEAPAPGDRHVRALLRLTDVRDLGAATGRLRRLLDLDADPEAVDEHLAQDPALRPLVAATPGVRPLGTVDPDETAVRVVLGQQVSTSRATTMAAQLVRTLGRELPRALLSPGGPTHLFPSAADVAAAHLEQLPGMPGARRRTLVALTSALAEGRVDLGPGSSWEEARAALAAVPGVGPWTVETIALRALGDPDALPASDLDVLRRAARAGLGATASELTARAGRWSPWRGYAVQLLRAGGPTRPAPHPTEDA